MRLRDAQGYGYAREPRGRGRRRRGRAEARREVLGDVGYAALEGNFAARRVAGYDVCLGAHHV